MRVPLVGGAGPGRSSDIAPETYLNWFAEGNGEKVSLVSTRGSTVLSTPAVAEVRGSIDYNGYAWFVVGNTLYRVDSAGTAVSKGALTTSTGKVSMAHNGTRTDATQEIFIADGTQRYIYDNVADLLTGYTDYAAVTVVFLDGYFVFNVADTDRFYITNLYAGSIVDPLDFATAEGAPDELLAVITAGRDLFLVGKKNLEVWYNSGDVDNTFQRYQGGFTQTGTAAKHSVSVFDNTICWLTQNKRGNRMVAMLGQGYQPNYISSPEVNYRLSTYTTYEDAFSYVYQHEGHEFYCLTFPSHKVTEVYDAVTKQWHQRGHVIDGVFPNRERYNCHVFSFGKHLFGDLSNGSIYQEDASVGTIDGTRIPRELVLPNLTDEEARIRVGAFQLDMQEGIGDPNETDDTGMWLSYSKDGGHVFSHEREATIGDTGKTKTRVRWRRLGQARNWIFKLRTWSPKPMVLKAAYVRLFGDS